MIVLVHALFVCLVYSSLISLLVKIENVLQNKDVEIPPPSFV